MHSLLECNSFGTVCQQEAVKWLQGASVAAYGAKSNDIIMPECVPANICRYTRVTPCMQVHISGCSEALPKSHIVLQGSIPSGIQHNFLESFKCSIIRWKVWDNITVLVSVRPSVIIVVTLPQNPHMLILNMVKEAVPFGLHVYQYSLLVNQLTTQICIPNK